MVLTALVYFVLYGNVAINVFICWQTFRVVKRIFNKRFSGGSPNYAWIMYFGSLTVVTTIQLAIVMDVSAATVFNWYLSSTFFFVFIALSWFEKRENIDLKIQLAITEKWKKHNEKE